MLQARVNDSATFRKIIEVIGGLVKTCNLDVTAGGISIQAMDNSHVALVSLLLKENGFSYYSSKRNMTLGMSLQNFSKILRCGGATDTLTLMCEDEDPSVIKMNFESKSRTFEFNLALQNIESQALGIPDTPFSSIVSMGSGEFARICKEYSTLSDSIGIETSKEYLKLSIQGESGSGSTVFRACEGMDNDAVNLEVDEPVSLSFSAKYLNIFNKAATLCDRVSLSLNSDTPLLVEYELPNNLGALKFYLAPKITEES